MLFLKPQRPSKPNHVFPTKTYRFLPAGMAISSVTETLQRYNMGSMYFTLSFTGRTGLSPNLSVFLTLRILFSRVSYLVNYTVLGFLSLGARLRALKC